MYKQNRFVLLIVLMLLLAGCASEGGFKLPGVYRVDVQQGNVIEQDTVNRLRPGMDRSQVQFIMGTPAIADPFHADQWDYIFNLSEGGGVRQQRHLRVYFEDGLLAYVDGDVVPSSSQIPEATRRSRTVEVPIRDDSDRSIFRRILNLLPFVGDEPPRRTANPDLPQQTGSPDLP